uniref:Peptidase S1 domain-containing protein n=1 Tax=Anopheles maculatus TaxID=74869 RepID=A0A182SR51_9DIPT
MIGGTFTVLKAFTVLWPLLIVCLHAQRQVNQACILTNGQFGRCVRMAECTEIAELANRNVLYSWETQKIRAVLGACASDENSSDPIDVLPVRCGMRQPVPSILSDAEDEDNTHVWAVHLEIRKPKETTLARCVGTLLQERYVLTAAHCLHHLPVENIKLFFGLNLISELSQCLADGDCQERTAAEFIIHPSYNSHTSTNDVALIRVSEPVDTTSYIMPVCLSLDHIFDESLPDDKRVLSLGWGRTGQGGMSDSKRLVYLNVISPDECGEHLANSTRISASMSFSVMCTLGVIRGQDVCQGDSGAPMLHFRDNQFFVVGVVSIGPKCDPAAGN